MPEQSLCPILVGRDAELSTLEDALLAARRGAGRVAVVSGDAGAGKSRLCAEFERRAAALGVTVLHGGCSEADLALPYLPFLEAVGNHLAAVDAAALGDRLGGARRELAALFPQFASPTDSDASGGDDMARKLRLFEALLALLRIVAHDDGLLLVVEDLHWGDASTRELLDYLVRRLPGNRILLVVNYRSDEMHRRHPLLPVVQGWKRSRLIEIIELHPMTVDQVATMVAAIFDEADVTEEFSTFLQERSEGNPFVLEEMLKDALDSGSIYRTAAGWERKSLVEFGVPTSVTDGIMLRVDRLGADVADVLRAAAVLGQTFDHHLLVGITGMSEPDVVAALRLCVQEQLLEEAAGAFDGYRFRHAITREAVYDDLILPERQRLHGRAAATLQSWPAATAAERATHLIAAGNWAEALPLCLQAAGESLRAYAPRTAADLYERALPHVTDPVQRTMVVLSLGEAQQQAGEPATAMRYLEEGVTELETRGDRITAAHYRLLLARCHWELSHRGVAQAEYDRARDELEQHGPSEDLAVAYVRLAGMRAFALDPAAAVDLADRAIEIAETASADLPRIWAYNFRGLGLVYGGHPDEGVAALDRSLEEALAAHYDVIAANALHNGVISRCHALRGAEAAAFLDRYGARLGPLLFGGSALPFLRGQVAFAAASLEDAERFFAEAVSAAAALGGDTALRFWAMYSRAEALLELGRPDEARQLLDRLHLDKSDAQDVVQVYSVWLLLHQVRGERALAEEAASRILETGALSTMSLRTPAVVEVLIRAGQLDEAARVANDPRATLQRGWMAVARGLVAAAAGDAATAVAELRGAAADFLAAQYRRDEARTRVRIARVLAGADDEAARIELAAASRAADEVGAVLVRREIEAVAADCGYVIPPPHAAGMTPGAQPDFSRAAERFVTVMFADVRGFTRMTATTAPGEVHDRIATFQRWAQQEVAREHGVVDKFAGDAVMATFNASGASVDHAAHAFASAVALQDKARALGLDIGVGIAVGAAIVGALAPGANVSVLGETTNRAARLQAQAGGGEIVLDEEAHRRLAAHLTDGRLATRRASLELKGFDEPVVGYVVTRA